MIVLKFGGSSVADGERIQDVAKIIQTGSKEKIVVVSALGGVTDDLTDIMNKVVGLPADEVEREVEDFTEKFLARHRNVAGEAVSDVNVRLEAIEEIKKLTTKLKVALLGVGYLEELTSRSADYILSFGERLSIIILAATLNSNGVKAKHLNGFEAGILTDSSFGRARPLFDQINEKTRENLLPLVKEGVIPVVAGFVAGDEKARITTLGRGGSDYTASIIGSALGADEVQIWTDVDGILSTDPRIVEEARLIKKISYVEALDLGYFGAKVIHSKMIEPAMKANVPVRVKNTFNPKNEGTLIVSKQEEIPEVVKAIAVAQDVVIVNLNGVGVAETPNIAGKLFSTLGDANINIIMISGSSESNLSFVVDKSESQKAVKLLERELGSQVVERLSLMEDVAIVTVVGAGMHGTKGIAAKIFTEIAEIDVNIIMIAQGSSEVNIAFMVLSEDVDEVVETLHSKFIGG